MSAIYKDGTLYPTGGSGSSGHTILDNTGTSLTDEPNLKFGGDFEVSDDSENDETEVAPHRLTSEELANICSPLPTSTANLPVLFDESGAEYVVGRYVNSQGKWKPVYRTTVNFGALPNATSKSVAHNIANVDKIVLVEATAFDGTYYKMLDSVAPNNAPSPVSVNVSASAILIVTGANRSAWTALVTFEYIKTTDTYQD